SPGPYVAGWKNGLFPIFDNADTETVVEAVTDYGEILGFSKHFPVTEYFTHPEPLSEHPFWLSAGRKIDFYFALPPEFQRQIAFFRRSDVSELPEFKVIAINEVGDLLFLAAVADDNGSRLTWRPALLLWERARNSQLPQLHEMELPAGFTVKQMTNNHVLGGLVKKIALDPENNPIRDPENPDLPLKTNRAAVLFPGEMMVDGNRDGKMSFFDRVIHHDDAVTKEKPYRFWLNNDHDIHHIVDGTDHEWDDASDNIPDSSSNVIFTPRDLEDYSRIRINFKGFTALAKDPTASVWIEWRAMDGSLKFAEEEGTPEIKFYQEKRPDMTPLYLEDEVAANEQLEAPYNSSIGSAIPGIPLQLFAKKSQLLEGFSEEAPVVNLLFCGITAGRGQLTLTIKRKNKVVVEFPPLYLELLDIKDMYERWSAGEDPKVAPRELSVRSLTGLPSGYKQAGHQRPFTYNSKDREEKKYILFVHGWNMTQADKDYFADTAYKRLFWQGYKGRFGSFEWPTTFGFGALLPDDTKFKNGVNGYYSVFSDPTCFDRGEFNAWRSSLALKRTFRVLNHHYPGNVNVLAHSMGNVVVGEALRCAAQEGLRKIVRSYVATQAAIPAHCYNGAVNAPLSAIVPAKILVKMLDGGFPETPNVYLNWLGANARAVGERVNFYNQNDYSLAQDIWHLNQYLKPDHYVRTDIDRNYTSTFDYRYKGDVTLAPLDNGFKKYSTGTHRFFDRYLGNAVDVKDRYEIMAFAAEARSKPLGSIPAINGFRSVNLQSLKIWPADTEQLKKPHSAHKWHSAQFRSTNMRQKGYWKTLLGEDGFKINTTQP
ncbi:MAG: alpha/beta hydrolase, partial [Verrucomicrobiota bacterium]